MICERGSFMLKRLSRSVQEGYVKFIYLINVKDRQVDRIMKDIRMDRRTEAAHKSDFRGFVPVPVSTEWI